MIVCIYLEIFGLQCGIVIYRCGTSTILHTRHIGLDTDFVCFLVGLSHSITVTPIAGTGDSK